VTLDYLAVARIRAPLRERRTRRPTLTQRGWALGRERLGSEDPSFVRANPSYIRPIGDWRSQGRDDGAEETASRRGQRADYDLRGLGDRPRFFAQRRIASFLECA